MPSAPVPIAPLCRVSLDLRLKVAAETSPARPFTFILGVGSGGLSPFEYALLEKRVGDQVALEIDPACPEATFEHLQPPLAEWAIMAGPMVVEARVLAVAPADSRQIIKAMASAAGGCGGQCGCGCSCGGHPAEH